MPADRGPATLVAEILSFLERRWSRSLDITTIDQAQSALGLPQDDEQRWEVYRRLESAPGPLDEKRRFGVSGTTVLLTNQEKLVGRAVILGGNEDEAQAAVGIDDRAWERAKAMLRRVGLLAEDTWRPAPGHEELLQGVGLLFHTVRVRGEVFNVP